MYRCENSHLFSLSDTETGIEELLFVTGGPVHCKVCQKFKDNEMLEGSKRIQWRTRFRVREIGELLPGTIWSAIRDLTDKMTDTSRHSKVFRDLTG